MGARRSESVSDARKPDITCCRTNSRTDFRDVICENNAVVVDHDARYLDLAGALSRRFPAGTPSRGVFLWIDQFCFPHDAATAFPARWFLQSLDVALREVGNLLLVLQDGDGFDLTSEPTWRRPPQRRQPVRSPRDHDPSGRA